MTTPTVKCPTCQTPSAWSSANPFRPFCSERCKLIDLGSWASEHYSIPVEEDTDIEIPTDQLE
jgi:endogenous inhibitor of DNA gyrase (YacG/DUF329 family)